jgi:hypothetical protein
LAFESEPAFELFSVEGSVGYPPDLRELDADDIKKMIADSERYANDVKALDELVPTD